MKQITICTMLLIFSTTSFSQQTTPSQTLTKQDYLLKSKRQLTTAVILAGGGVVLYVAGAIAYQHGNAGLILIGAGLLAQLSSIPFFISAVINKTKARKASLSFKFEKNQPGQLIEIGYRSYPAISLKLNL